MLSSYLLKTTVTVDQAGFVDATIVVAIIGAVGALVGVLLDRRRAAAERQRATASNALADVLLWLEVPYRIARRTSDDAAELSRLVGYMHELQERQTYHSAWLELEIPAAVEAFNALLDAVKEQARVAVQLAWASPPKTSGPAMNVGELFVPDVDALCRSFVEAVRDAVRPYPFG